MFLFLKIYCNKIWRLQKCLVFIKNSFYHQTIYILSPVTRNFLWGEISIFPGFDHCKQICQEIMAINFTGAVFVNLSNLFTTWPAQGGNFYFEPYCMSRPKGGLCIQWEMEKEYWAWFLLTPDSWDWLIYIRCLLDQGGW